MGATGSPGYGYTTELLLQSQYMPNGAVLVFETNNSGAHMSNMHSLRLLHFFTFHIQAVLLPTYCM